MQGVDEKEVHKHIGQCIKALWHLTKENKLKLNDDQTDFIIF